MTREEAQKYFNGTGEDDLEDAYEEQLFEYKQFLLSKAPISKLYESRQKKLAKLGEAYELLMDRHTSELPGMNIPEIASPVIAEAYLAFQKAKNELKRQISNASSAWQLLQLSEALVALEKSNASLWAAETADDDVIVSREPDPMYLLEAIKTYRTSGGETFVQLKNLENNPPALLVQEMKRLSLLFKKF